MSVYLDTQRKTRIPVTDMRDGQIAIIVAHQTNPNYIGRVVQHYGDTLITIGGKKEYSWSNPFANKSVGEIMRVRLLEKGEHIIIEEN